MPKVSVILTSYNHEQFIHEAIDSVLQQTFQDFELIIWDDASSDKSWDIIQQYTDTRIKSFRNEVNQGPVFGVNKAILEIVTGEYIALHHSDDIWETHKLQLQVDFLDNFSNIGAVFSNVLPINEQGLLLTDATHIYTQVFNQANKSRHEWLRFFFLYGNALCHPSILIRRQCYTDCGLYRPMLAQLPDFDLWMRLCMKYEIYVLSEKLIRFRVRDEEANTSGNRRDTRIRTAYENYAILVNYQGINSFEELAKIFPNAQKYYRGEETNIIFVLAMVMLEDNHGSFRALFAQNLLFSIISDSLQAAQVKLHYQFDIHCFIALTGHNDVFFREEINTLLHKINTLEQTITNQEQQLNQAIAERNHVTTELNQLKNDYKAILDNFKSKKNNTPSRFIKNLFKN